MVEIGHLVKFPDCPIIDPPPTEYGAWATQRVYGSGAYAGDQAGFVMTRVLQQPHRYDELDGFLYLSRDRVATTLIGISTRVLPDLAVCSIAQQAVLLARALDRAWKSPIGEKHDLFAYAVFFEKKVAEPTLRVSLACSRVWISRIIMSTIRTCHLST